MLRLLNKFAKIRPSQQSLQKITSCSFTQKKNNTKLEKEPTFWREIITAIKNNTANRINLYSRQVKYNVNNFKNEANSYKTNVGNFRTAYNITKLAWRRTFPKPDQDVKSSMEIMKQEMIKQQKVEIPEWKKNAIIQVEKQEIKSLRQILKKKLKKSEYFQELKKTKQYKDYEEFRNVMKDFSQEAQERFYNHPSNLVQGGIFVYKRATSETETALAISKMKTIDPKFDIFKLEQEAKVIFEDIYQAYLQNDSKTLEDVCGEGALGYFKILMKQREQMQAEPKYKKLWNVNEAIFLNSKIDPLSQLPQFLFTIRTQQIYCYVSKNNKNIVVEGDKERIMSMDYNFILAPHSSPVVENVGHKWELIFIQPSQAIKLLV